MTQASPLPPRQMPPRHVENLMAYAKRTAALLCTPGVHVALDALDYTRLEAAKNFLGGDGVQLFTRYSGMGMAEIAVHRYRDALLARARESSA